jgi:hypothetical protein
MVRRTISIPRMLALALSLASLIATATAGATAQTVPLPLEGVWSFNGGKVAIQHVADGSYTGTVVAPTKFAECSHPVGEAMWTEIRQEASGSFRGLHQWFFEGAACVANPKLGPTAWRVMEQPGGGAFLRACFSAPGTSQPSISVSGVATGVTYACVDSALIAPAPSTSGAAGFKSAVVLPGTHRCLSRRVFRIHFRDPGNDPLREVVVTLKGRRLRVIRHGNVFASTVDLRGLPPGAFTVRIRVLTVLGHRLRGARTYHTCVPGRSRKPHR